MAAFSNHHPFLIDLISPPHPTTTTTTCFSQFYPLEPPHQIPVDVGAHQSSWLGNSTKLGALSNNEASVITNNKQSTESSSVVDKPEIGEQVTQKKVMITSIGKKRSISDGSSSMSSVQSMDAREVKGKKPKKCDGVGKDDKGKKGKVGKKDQKIKVAEEVPTGYVHVRARRGQATDSHSLAERVRREKISVRMKQLQGLVPGCDKVTGKALVLDEIINYVQSLQNQVEFLSMQLASVNPMPYDFGVELDEFMVTPHERLNSMESPFPNGQQCCPAFSDTTTTTTTFSTPSAYPLLDSISSFLFDDQQVQMPLQPQDNGQHLWDVDEQRQELIHQSGFSNNLCSFHYI